MVNIRDGLDRLCSQGRNTADRVDTNKGMRFCQSACAHLERMLAGHEYFTVRFCGNAGSEIERTCAGRER